MSNRIKSKTVYCKDKQRDVEIKYSDSGTWLKPSRKVVSCPAIEDAGATCTYKCIKETGVLSSIRGN